MMSKEFTKLELVESLIMDNDEYFGPNFNNKYFGFKVNQP